MKYVSMTQAKASLDDYLEICETELVVLTRRGKPVAYLSPLAEDTDLEHLALMANPEFREIQARGLTDAAASRTISLEAARQELEADADT